MNNGTSGATFVLTMTTPSGEVLSQMTISGTADVAVSTAASWSRRIQHLPVQVHYKGRHLKTVVAAD